MNKMYRMVWSLSRQTMTVAPETAKSGGGQAGPSACSFVGHKVRRVFRLAATAALLLSAWPALLWAAPPAATQLPTGAQVSAGTASVSQGPGAVLNVNQTSNRAVVNWTTFDVGSAARVNFNQPSAAAVTLNRVMDSNPSQILGRIVAPGQVILSNPNGVYFGAGATVDVGGLTATTHGMSDADFMAGKSSFARNGATGSVVNEGELNAALGGYIVMLAPQVRNSGVIVAQAGTVTLAAGERITLNFGAANSLTGITVTPAAIRTLVENRHAVLAPGGLILLSARGSDRLQGSVVNSGTISAASLQARGGRIVLEGDDIALKAGATLDASGATGGGTVLVGGDWQGSNGGSNPMHQATTTTVEQGASIRADATQAGDGGKVVVWSDVGNANSLTALNGSIQAQGGPQGGQGGQVETSGHGLMVGGQAIVRTGAGGQWLLDPANVTISGAADASHDANFVPDSTASTSIVNVATLQSALNGGGNVTVTTTNAGTSGAGNGDIYVNASISKTAGPDATLTLKADRDVLIGTQVSNTSITSSAGKLNLVLWADQDSSNGGVVRIENNSTITTNGGHLWAGGGSGSTSWNGLTVGNGYASTVLASATTWQQGLSVRNSSISTAGGIVQLSGMNSRDAVGARAGVLIDTASTISTGAGDLGIDGQAVSIPTTSLTIRGVEFSGGAALTTTTGNITITGTSQGANNGGQGVFIQNATIGTSGGSGGTISITGSTDNRSGSGGSARHGIQLFASGASTRATLSTVAGNITLTGTSNATNQTNSAGVQFLTSGGNDTSNGVISVVSRAGNVTIVGDNPANSATASSGVKFDLGGFGKAYLGFDGANIAGGGAFTGDIGMQARSLALANVTAGYLNLQGSGALSITPTAASFFSGTGGTLAPLVLDSQFNLGSTHSSLTLGKAGNAAGISLNSAQTVNGPVNVYGGNVTVNGAISAAGSLLLNGDTGSALAGDFIGVTLNAPVSTTAASIGDITIIGRGSSTSFNSGRHGVFVNNVAVSAGGTGAVTITGQGGLSANAASGSDHGIGLDGANALVSASNGNVTLNGTGGGSGAGTYSQGVAISNNARVSAGGAGTVSITGTGGATAVAGQRGVVIDYGRVDSAGGAISITGIGGASGTGDSSGISLGGAGATPIGSATSGAITLTGTGRGTGNDFNAYAGSMIGGASPYSQDIRISADTQSYTSSTITTLGRLTVEPRTSNFTGTFSWPAAGLTLTPGLTGLTLGKDIGAATHTDTIAVAGAQSIAGPIRIYGGDVNLNASLTTTTASKDVLVKASGNINQAGNVAVSTAGGAVTYWADSDADATNYGAITLNPGSSIASSGGAITLGGGASLASGYATARVTGTGNTGGDLAGQTNAGVSLFNASIDAGTGSVTLRGQSVGTADDFSHGISIRGDAGSSSVTGGTLSLTGVSDEAANAGGNGSSNRGISLLSTGGGTVAVTGSGTVSLAGTGSSGPGGFGVNNRGVYLRGATVASTGADLVLTGTGRSTSANNEGIGLFAGADVHAATTVTLNGTGSTTAIDVNANGIRIDGAGASVYSTGNGQVTLNGIAGAGISPAGVLLANGATLGSGTTAGNIVINADSLSVPSAASITTTGALTVQPISASFSSALAWPISGLTVGAGLTGETLGKPGNTADITVNSAQTVSGPISVYGGNLTLNAPLTATGSTITLQGSAAGGVTQGAGAALTADKLALLGGGTDTLLNSGNSVSTLAAQNVGNLAYRNAGALTIDSAGAAIGIAASGQLLVETLAGDLTVQRNVCTTDSSASALTLNAGRASAAGDASGGNLLVAGSPLISVGAGGVARLFSGSVAGSAGLTTLVGAGSGRFRYNSDETVANYSTPLLAGLDAIYREQPTVTLTAASGSIIYGSALPALASASGAVNGDLVAASGNVAGALSASGNYVVGAHAITPTSAGAVALGYAASASGTGSLTVTPLSLTVTGTTVTSKPYDGTGAASLVGGTLNGVIAGDTVTLTQSGTFASANAGNGIVVTANDSIGGAASGNYAIVQPTGLAGNITPRPVAVSGLAAADRAYDATTGVTITSWGSVVTGVAGETLALNHGVAAFADPNAGTGKLVSATGYSLANGTGQAGNYQLTSTSASTTADIAPAPLTLGAVSDTRTYDTTRTSTRAVQVGGLAPGDSVSGLSQSFDSRNAGARTLLVNPGWTVSDGNGGSNYAVTTTSASGMINPASLQVSGVTANGKVYDATTAVTLAGGSVTALGADQVTLNTTGASGVFSDRNAGTGKPVTASGYLLGGADAGNYQLVQPTGLVASIAPRPLSLAGSTGINKTDDGTADLPAGSSGHGALAGLLGNDQVNATGAGRYDSAAAGLRRVVQGTVALGGNDAGNYVLAWVDGSGTISARPAPPVAPANPVDTNLKNTVPAVLPPDSPPPLVRQPGRTPAGPPVVADAGTDAGGSAGAQSAAAGIGGNGSGGMGIQGVLLALADAKAARARGEGRQLGPAEWDGRGERAGQGRGAAGDYPGCGNRVGTSVCLIREPGPRDTGVVTVNLPRAAGSGGAGIRFRLPDELAKGQLATAPLTVRQLHGSRLRSLPGWLRYLPDSRVFVAGQVPRGGLPMRVVVDIGDHHSVVLVFERDKP